MAVINNIIRDMRPFMKENGFSLYKKCFFYIKNDLAYCVELEIPTRLIYVTCYIVPLYVPTDFRYYTYGMRLKAGLETSNMCTSILEQWCDQLKKYLGKSIFPVFNEAQTPHAFMNLVDKGLFNDSFHINKVDIYRLRLFTAFYEKNVAAVSKLCGEYEDVLADTTHLTYEVKKSFFDEAQIIKNSISKSTQENEAAIMDIIKKTKQSCFGLS